ncbi:MAG: cobyrinate a,c-diamide synthase [Prevotella sp.]|nr:cobyrinate a,c-diamide synthase [Prevotella sp.]
MKASFMIAAPSSGSGKTTIARGLMSLFVSKGKKVQPFKCGPDYIDTKFHELVCCRPSINLDTFMASPQHVQGLFAHYGKDADMCVVEGMMGLFDGYDRDLGSSSEIARTLGLPVVLVVDAKRSAYSLAALLTGFVHFREDVHVCGVIFNRVGSERHERMLRQVCDDIGLECFGFLPNHRDLEQGSRYLGLDFSEMPEAHTLVSLLEEHVNWKRLLELGAPTSILQSEESACRNAPGPKVQSQTSPEAVGAGLVPARKPKVQSQTSPEVVGAGLVPARKLVVARNEESFSFIYQETLDAFQNVAFFDPETEVPSLDDSDLLYLPGGYPEKHLDALTKNVAAREAIRLFAERGGRVFAECGGMMYLCKSILDDTGEYPMCGVLPYVITARKEDRKLSLGYRRFTLDGTEHRGHEFHYTRFLGETPKSITQVYNAKGEPVDTPVFRHKNVIASYTHLYHIYETDLYQDRRPGNNQP